ncbi:MAG: RIP metalloprotease RseP [Pseudomonadota bacterium]
MELISNIPFFGGFLATIIPFIAVLAIVVSVHEYGHYIVARWCGIHSEVFSVGFGPVIWSRTDRRGTLWQIAALPLGGYVRFVGDSDGSSQADQEALAQMSEADRQRSFHGAAIWKRSLTVAAGPVANFILTIIVFAGIVTYQGTATDEPVVGEVFELPGDVNTVREGDQIVAVNGTSVDTFQAVLEAALAMETPGPMEVRLERDGSLRTVEAPYAFPPLVQGVEPLSPASEAGLQRGDVIMTAAGVPLTSFDDLRNVVMASGDRSITLGVWRDGEAISLQIVPTDRDADDGEGGFERRVMIGVAGGPMYLPATHTPMPWTAVAVGADRMVGIIVQSLNGIKHMITGALSPDNLQGPVGIAQVSGESAQQGFLSFIVLIGVISTAIGMLNLFPIPILDGGHLLAFLIEAIRGRPPSPAIMQIAMSIGLGLILLLMVFATYNDIMRLVS